MNAFLNRTAPMEPPPILPAFSHMQRHWDPENERWSIKILPGVKEVEPPAQTPPVPTPAKPPPN